MNVFSFLGRLEAMYAALSESARMDDNRLLVSDSSLTMADFPNLTYSMKEVMRVGEALKGDLIWSAEAEPEIIEIFRVAHNWRESHAYPMRSIRQEMIARMMRLGMDGITAARLKRMQSIRTKLRRIPAKLNQIQDLGGCRAIFASMSDAHRFIDDMKNSARHGLLSERDYINNPKIGGYRCHHLMFKFRGSDEDEAFSGRRIEIQIRTRLQHSWATAVEAVGLFRREDMKAGQGDPDWLRLFDLMSAELAIAEDCPESENVPRRSERVKEIRELDRKLNAVVTLQKLRDAIHFSERPRSPTEKPNYYRIEYNNETRSVEVSEYSRPLPALSDLSRAEQYDNIHSESRINTVFVEADRIEALKDAYPNYFGDVELFSVNLRDITQGKHAQEYTMPPLKTPPRFQKLRGDLSWLRPGRKRQWEWPGSQRPGSGGRRRRRK